MAAPGERHSILREAGPRHPASGFEMQAFVAGGVAGDRAKLDKIVRFAFHDSIFQCEWRTICRKPAGPASGAPVNPG